MSKCPNCGCDEDVFLDEIKRLRQALEKIRDFEYDGTAHDSAVLAAIVAADALKPQLMMKDDSK